MPLFKGARPQHSRNFCDLLPARAQYEKNNQTLHGDQTKCEDSFFTRLTTNGDERSVCAS